MTDVTGRIAVLTEPAATSTALLTDHYELTMLRAALRDGTAQRRCVFEVFSRRLPEGRRYGILAGTARVLDAITRFRFTPEQLQRLVVSGVVDDVTCEYLQNFAFSGDVDGFAEGEAYFPDEPVLVVSGTFAECVVLETVILSILNHDTAVASAAARMVTAACGRPVVEMGSRRTHEDAAVAAARATYIAGFTSTSNLAAGERYGIPTTGTSAHAFTLLHDDEQSAFRAQIAALGVGTTLLVDTYDVTRGVENAVAVAGPQLGAVRLDSGDLTELAREVREQLDKLGADKTRIVVTSDLDEYAIAALAVAPVDVYGVGTSVVTGSGAPTASFVYKLVARALSGEAGAPLVPVAKRSARKHTRGGRKEVLRALDGNGIAVEDVIFPAGEPPQLHAGDRYRPLLRALMRGGEVADVDAVDLAAAREQCHRAIAELPREAHQLSRGEPAISVRYAGFPEPDGK